LSSDLKVGSYKVQSTFSIPSTSTKSRDTVVNHLYSRSSNGQIQGQTKERYVGPPSPSPIDQCLPEDREKEGKKKEKANILPETVPPPCLPALSTLLACFATSGDLRANEACATAAKSLHTCMAGSKGAVKASKSSVSLLILGIGMKLMCRLIIF
jgi:hypothetical protein